jgi:formate hydrogenlyase subunit 6/NADH:ubiquinone oxidoreductase subunit I
MERELLTSATHKANTIAYPKRKQLPVEGLRRRIIWHIETCIGCGLCPPTCLSEAIVMTRKSTQAEIMYHLNPCIYCRDCVTICPPHSIEVVPEYELAFKNQQHMMIHYHQSQSSTET